MVPRQSMSLKKFSEKGWYFKKNKAFSINNLATSCEVSFKNLATANIPWD